MLISLPQNSGTLYVMGGYNAADVLVTSVAMLSTSTLSASSAWTVSPNAMLSARGGGAACVFNGALASVSCASSAPSLSHMILAVLNRYGLWLLFLFRWLPLLACRLDLRDWREGRQRCVHQLGRAAHQCRVLDAGCSNERCAPLLGCGSVARCPVACCECCTVWACKFRS